LSLRTTSNSAGSRSLGAAGTLRVEFSGESVVLETGDSCSCHADAPHRFDNSRGKTRALLYLVVER